ncbi:MAG TPA: exo-alpha-sialidase [Candidatus Thermoplasmatota archaeon]|nr:exo-alpha-sialidase [Candidatus Thermoplasmatota archaeon]
MDVKKGDTVVVAGTKKGAFLLASRDRRKWRAAPAGFEGVSVYHAALDPRDGRTVWAGVTSEHWGPTVQRTTTWGRTWKPTGAVKFPEASKLAVSRVWHVAPGLAPGELWAGVEPAGLFHSADGGATWESVDGFNLQPGREDWFPGGGGLCLHTILPDPRDAKRLVVAASAVGVFETRDGGATWAARNGGVRADHLPAGKTGETDLGSCPHKLARDAKDPGTLYMQNHAGVYRRKEGASKWTDVNKALPSRFGFPMVAHPHDGGTVYTVPLEGDFNRVSIGGAPAVHRTRDGGSTWQRHAKGMPTGAWLTTLRDGMATDGRDPAGIYVGTTTGQVFASRDEGVTWAKIADHLPPVLSLSAGVAR